MKTGIEIIAEERQRQIEAEGWTIEHDAEHENNELAIAAACYALPISKRTYRDNLFVPTPVEWPWEYLWWKPCPEDRIHELAKAGALIAAEIDRLNNISDETTLQP